MEVHLRLFSLMLTALSLNLALGVSAQAACRLTKGQILTGIQEWAAEHGTEAKYVQAGTVVGGISLVAAWESLDNVPRFRKCGMNLGPNDLRYVYTVDELIGVIAWNLKSK